MVTSVFFCGFHYCFWHKEIVEIKIGRISITFYVPLKYIISKTGFSLLNIMFYVILCDHKNFKGLTLHFSIKTIGIKIFAFWSSIFQCNRRCWSIIQKWTCVNSCTKIISVPWCRKPTNRYSLFITHVMLALNLIVLNVHTHTECNTSLVSR